MRKELEAYHNLVTPGSYIVATDGLTTWQLHADRYNALLLRCESLPPQPPPLPVFQRTLKAEGADAGIASDGTLTWQGQERRFPELAQASSIAAVSHTVAVALPTSHHLFLVGLS